jgi:phage terminase large subunit-like protein
VFWEVGRKQGKTLLAGGIGNYFAYAAGEYGSEIYYIAPKLDQADLCYSAFEFNVNQEDELKRRTKSTKYRGLFIQENNTTVKKLPFTDRKSDGYNPMFYCADEVASWPGERGLKQWEVMASGTGARVEPMGLAISSAGYENEGIFDELMKRGTAFLNRVSQEEHFLPILYQIDDLEKWDDINELRKSLPGLGKSVSVKFILNQIDTAKESTSKKSEFLTKYCNIKQNASTAWFEAPLVQSMFGTDYKLEDFRNSYGLGGLDLSQTTDLTSACILIEREGVIWIFSHFWLPTEKLKEATERDQIPYQAMIDRGFLTLSGDNFVDYKSVFDWFVKLVDDYKIYPLITGYDRYSSQYLVQDMQNYGFHMDSVFQGFNLSGIMDNLEGLMRNGQIKSAQDNSLLKIHFMDAAQQLESNTSVHNRKKLVKISKYAHVDGVAAILDALCMRQNKWAELGEQLKNES